MIVIGPVLRQYAMVIVVNLMALSVGMDLGWTSPVLVKLSDLTQSPLSRLITEEESGWIVSIGYISSIVMLPCIGILLDYIGRKYCILIISLPKIIAGMLLIFATQVWMLLVARAINLTMNSALTMIIIIYSTEIASKEIRGSTGSLLSMFNCLGVLLMLGIGPYISYRNLNIMMCAVTVCACIPLLFVPDTPYSLYNKGNIEEAKKVLVFFRGSETLAEDEIKKLALCEPKQKFDRKEIFKNKAYIKALLIAVLLGIAVQFNGFYFILFYLQTILELSNTSISPALCSLIVGVIQVLGSISAGAVSDRFGRKLIITTSSFGIAIGMMGLLIFFLLKQNGTIISGFLNYLPLISIAFVSWCHSGGVSCQYLVLVAELLDDKIRGMGTSVSVIAATASLFIISKFTLTILSALGFVGSFLMFSVISIMISLYVFFFVPETKQKSFADIQRILGGLKDEGEKKNYVTRL